MRIRAFCGGDQFSPENRYSPFTLPDVRRPSLDQPVCSCTVYSNRSLTSDLMKLGDLTKLGLIPPLSE